MNTIQRDPFRITTDTAWFLSLVILVETLFPHIFCSYTFTTPTAQNHNYIQMLLTRICATDSTLSTLFQRILIFSSVFLSCVEISKRANI